MHSARVCIYLIGLVSVALPSSVSAGSGTVSVCGEITQNGPHICSSDCLANQSTADHQCLLKCGGGAPGSHVVVSAHHSCELPPLPTPPPIPPKPTTSPANCVGGSAPGDATPGSNTPLDHKNGPSGNVAMSCVALPAGKTFSKTWCKLSDDWGTGWCKWGQDCGYWGGPSLPPYPGWYYDQSKGWRYCITGINDSGDRNRHWQIFAK